MLGKVLPVMALALAVSSPALAHDYDNRPVQLRPVVVAPPPSFFYFSWGAPVRYVVPPRYIYAPQYYRPAPVRWDRERWEHERHERFEHREHREYRDRDGGHDGRRDGRHR